MSVRGWINYYGIAQMKRFLQVTDAWLRRRIRTYIWKRRKTPKTRITSLINYELLRPRRSELATQAKDTGTQYIPGRPKANSQIRDSKHETH